MIGKRPFQLLDDLDFGRLVDFAGIILFGFLDDVQAVDATDVTKDDVSGTARGLDHDIQRGLLHTDSRK